MNAYRVWAEIDLDALAHNLRVIRGRAGHGIRVMLVVKADAYGHGAIAIAHHAVRSGIAALGVGTSAEALELRHSGILCPILVLGTIVDDEAAAVLRHGIEIGIHSSDRAQMLQELGRRLGLRARVHLNVDTGMGRLGVLPDRTLSLLEELAGCDHLELAGVMTHISSPLGALSESTTAQVRLFDSILERGRARNLIRGWIHVASSAPLFTGMGSRYDTVRPGISAYGILPGVLPGAMELRPVMSLKSQVVFLKDLPAGAPVGYASTWRAPHPTRIATLPVGYDDGVSWRLGNRGEVLVRGIRAPIVGRVSMDYTTIDVGHIPGVSVGDTAVLLGAAEGQAARPKGEPPDRISADRISAEQVARKAHTIPYEITCSIGKRVRRVYTGGAEIAIPAVPPREVSEPRGVPDAIPRVRAADASARTERL